LILLLSYKESAAFKTAINAIVEISTQLLCSLETNPPPKSREEEVAKLTARRDFQFENANTSG